MYFKYITFLLGNVYISVSQPYHTFSMFIYAFWTLIVSTLLSMGASESSQDASKYLNLCSEDELRSYGLERHEGV